MRNVAHPTALHDQVRSTIPSDAGLRQALITAAHQASRNTSWTTATKPVRGAMPNREDRHPASTMIPTGMTYGRCSLARLACCPEKGRQHTAGHDEVRGAHVRRALRPQERQERNAHGDDDHRQAVAARDRCDNRLGLLVLVSERHRSHRNTANGRRRATGRDRPFCVKMASASSTPRSSSCGTSFGASSE